jgi:hypothetical protein
MSFGFRAVIDVRPSERRTRADELSKTRAAGCNPHPYLSTRVLAAAGKPRIEAAILQRDRE